MVAMLVLGELEGREAPVGRAGRHHRHLALEGNEAFEDRRRLADRVPGCREIAASIDPHLAFAVIAEASRLEDGAWPDLGGRGLEIAKPIDAPERRRADAAFGEEGFLDEPVLCHG